MKKLLAITLSLCLITGALLCFASCEDDDKPNSDQGTEQGGNTPDDGNNGGNAGDGPAQGGEGPEDLPTPDLTDDEYPEDTANDIF